MVQTLMAEHGMSQRKACMASGIARHQNQPSGKTVLWRVYCQLKLNLPRRGKKRLPARIRQRLEAGNQPNLG